MTGFFRKIKIKNNKYDSSYLNHHLHKRLTMSQERHMGEYGEFQNDLYHFKRAKNALLLWRKNKLDTHKSTLKNFRMKSSTSIINIVSYYFILLFIYAAVSKLIDFETFYTQLEQTPLLKSYSKFIAYGVLFSELMTAGLLCYRKTRRTGIIFSFILMLLFSIYIIGILKFSKNLPCSCGGILEKMSWTEHLYFNIGNVLLAGSAIISQIFSHKKAGAFS